MTENRYQPLDRDLDDMIPQTALAWAADHVAANRDGIRWLPMPMGLEGSPRRLMATPEPVERPFLVKSADNVLDVLLGTGRFRSLEECGSHRPDMERRIIVALQALVAPMWPLALELALAEAMLTHPAKDPEGDDPEIVQAAVEHLLAAFGDY